MQFMVSRRLVRLGGVDPPYRQKKTKKKRAATAVAYILCLVRGVSPPLSKGLLERAELSFCFWRTDMANFVDFTISNGAP